MNILVTAIGSFSAECVISTLKSHQHKVVGCDIYPQIWHYVSKLCDNVYQSPYATEEQDYINFLIDSCKKEQLDAILPLTDLEIDVLNKNRQIFKKENIQLLMQTSSCLAIARDKMAMYNLFVNDSHINVPASCHSTKLKANFPIPAIAKPTNGRSSEGLMRITDSKQFDLVMDKENYIIQEMIPGTVFTVDYVRDHLGNDFAIPREELLRTKNGAGTTVRIIADTSLQKAASYIGEKLNIIGCVNIEFIANKDQFYLIDINPRFSAGIAFTHKIGFDVVTSHLCALTGQAICAPINFKEQIICKHYQESVLWTKPD